MSVVARVGQRLYEFETLSDMKRAYEIYAHSTGSQNEFEEEMEDTGVSFIYEQQGGYYPE